MSSLEDDSDIEALLSNLGAAASKLDRWPSGVTVPDGLKEWQEESIVLRAHLVSYIIESCERFDREAVVGSLSSVFRKLKENEHIVDICFSTTNYDRIIEFACDSAGLEYSDGFGKDTRAVAARWTGEFGNRVRLYKLHGSVTYYVEDTEVEGNGSRFWRLDRGYPLPGPEFRLSRDGRQLEPLMVLPSKEKETSEDPYGQLNLRFAESMSKTRVVVAVGTSMRDSDLVSAFKFNAGNVVVLLVDKDPAIGRGRVQNVACVPLRADAVDFFAVSTDRLVALFERCSPEMDKGSVLHLVEEFVDGEVNEISRRAFMSEEQREAYDVVTSDSRETDLLRALWRLRGIADGDVINAVAKRCEPNNTVEIRKAAAGCLGSSGNTSAVPSLRACSIVDPSADVRLEGYLALLRLGSDEGLAALETARRMWPEDTYFRNRV